MAKREVNREVESFRLANQEKCARREYDLDDPLQKKKSLPARLDDTDENNPVSGIQKLAGEDLQVRGQFVLQEYREQARFWDLADGIRAGLFHPRQLGVRFAS